LKFKKFKNEKNYIIYIKNKKSGYIDNKSLRISRFMENQEKVKKIVELTEIISQNYLENINGRDIKVLKEKLKDFLTNPLWNDKLIIQLKEEIDELKINEENLNEIWKKVELKLDSSYFTYLKRKPHIFEGKIKEYENRLIDFFVKAGQIKGQSKSFATIVGYFIIHKSLTQAQVKELTGFSKGSVSTNLNYLESFGSLKKKLIKGTREYLYSFGRNISQISTSTGAFKKEINQMATQFFQSKIEELNNYKGKKGYELLSKRLIGVMKFLKIHKRLIDHIMDSDFIKNVINGKI